jgi:hypothetical protein
MLSQEEEQMAFELGQVVGEDGVSFQVLVDNWGKCKGRGVWDGLMRIISKIQRKIVVKE